MIEAALILAVAYGFVVVVLAFAFARSVTDEFISKGDAGMMVHRMRIAGLAALLGISAAAASGCGLKLVRGAELEQLRRDRDEARAAAEQSEKLAAANAAEAWEWFGKLGETEAAAGKSEAWKRQYERCSAELRQLEDPGKH